MNWQGWRLAEVFAVGRGYGVSSEEDNYRHNSDHRVVTKMSSIEVTNVSS